MSDGCYRSDCELESDDNLPYWERVAKCRAQQIVDLKSQLSELLLDKQRLDAVERNHWQVWWNDRSNGFIVQERDQVAGNIGRGRTVREAIDDAIGNMRRRLLDQLSDMVREAGYDE
jgi:hypothetical protein